MKNNTKIYKAHLIMQGLDFLNIPKTEYSNLVKLFGGQDNVITWIEKQLGA